MSKEQWGPWIDHDGKGCPCVGEYVNVIFDEGSPKEIEGSVKGLPAPWNWHLPRLPKAWGKVIRYRIRKPKGLTMLECILAEVETKQPKVYVDVEV